MTEYLSLYWREGTARLKSWSLSGKGSIKVEIEVSDSFTLGDLVSSLQRIEEKQKPVRKSPLPKR